MSLSNWKRLAQKRTETGKMKNQLYDEITEEKIKSKTSDARITKSFRLDEIIEGLRAQKPKNRPQMKIRPAPAGKPDEIDYAPEVDPYEDMDVEGLLDLQDYVAPGTEKQIAKMPEGPPPKYEMEPSFWNLEGDKSLPPEYSAIEEEPSAIEAPREEFEGEEDERQANKILDHLELPNYDDVELRLAEPEMTATKQRNYLDKVVKDAETRRRQVIAFKATLLKNLIKVRLMQQKEIEYIKIQTDLEESLMIILSNIDLKANQRKVTGPKESVEVVCISIMMLKNY